VGIFASGYESRSRHVAQETVARGIAIDEPCVFGFEAMSLIAERRENDQFFKDHKFRVHEPVGYSDAREIWKQLSLAFKDRSESSRVLVDYSCMSRLWMSAIVSWLFESNQWRGGVVDFAYSPGVYGDKVTEETSIKAVQLAPGSDGGLAQMAESVLLCAVGADEAAAFALREHLEPKEVIAFKAANVRQQHIQKQVADANSAFFRTAKAVVDLPFNSVSQDFQVLTDVARPYIGRTNVIMAALGPKPHHLAMALAGKVLPQIHVLHVSRNWNRGQNVAGSNPLLITRVTLKETA
jgi:hypothetical protein